MYDSIVIGCGIAGSVVARELAEQGGRRVLVLEKRGHIGGNCYDDNDEHGILIHQYGPHIFHTNLEHVFAYLSRFTGWHLFGHEVVANVHGKLIPIPFNLNTLRMVYEREKADRLEQKLADAYGRESRVPILRLRESADEEIRALADYVYENVFLRYTMKQWGQTPEEIDPEVTGRVPVLVSRDNRYFPDKYQGVPIEGYTRMFEELLRHTNIEVRLDTDARELVQLRDGRVCFRGEPFAGDVVYTGPIDDLLEHRFGMLPYRSLDFDFVHLDAPDFQGHAVVNYTVSEDYTRITEFKHMTGQEADGTTIVREYPRAYEGAPGQIPYYAIMNPQNEALYQRYRAELAGMENFHLLGRLAEYRYYNIDAMVDKALALSRNLMK